MLQSRKSISEDYLIEEKRFSEIDIHQNFFNLHRQIYGISFNEWAKRKESDSVYTVFDNGCLIGFLKLKIEDSEEDYSDMNPVLPPKRRMKISSLRVLPGHHGLGTMLMKIILAKSIEVNVDEIYGTVPDNLPELKRVIDYLTKWGFGRIGIKTSDNVREYVYVLSLSTEDVIDNLFAPTVSL